MTKEPSFKRAVYWAYAMNWGGKGFGAAFGLLLAAILGPRDFGVVALAMIYIAFVQMILDQGLFSALIQRKDLTPEHMDAVFWLNIAVSLILVVLTLLVSGWWAAACHVPELGPVIRVLSSIVLIEALAKAQRAVLQREMDFKSLAIRSNASVVTGGVVGVTMAFSGYGVWALVGQRVCEDSMALILLWGLGHWRPRLRFSMHHLKDLLGFSTATFLVQVGNFAYGQADAASMGIFFGPVAVGLFRLAQKLVNLVVDSTSSSLQVVSFSEFSRHQDHPVELRRSVLNCLKLASMITFPTLAGMAFSSRQLMTVLGDKWVPAAGALTVLSAFGITHAISAFTGPLLMARSKPHLVAGLTWLVNLVGVSAIVATAILLRYASVEHQVLGMAAVRLAVSACLMAPVFLFFLFRVSQIRLREFLHAVGPSAMAAVATALTVWLLNASGVLLGLKPLGQVACDVTLGGASALGTLLVMHKAALTSARDLVRQVLRQVSGNVEAGEQVPEPTSAPIKGVLD